ncbi:hypothetical protein [Paenibacillus physcomitrellae]|uniref:Uncharacterized protein n=1 Tax=Paenibacillus physcomitrellae TaxID=1619311 RepID=A0ABQ1G0W7_9BACL|nr:hypothetical protein [Paenibacillus physcomitrellae]GGA34521.1 hypothetical protein GCM10010917_19740 [Paenibacillus physcomitrellae]
MPYIETIKALGITDDYGKAKLNLADKVTKEQFPTFLVRVHGNNEEAKSLPIQP